MNQNPVSSKRKDVFERGDDGFIEIISSKALRAESISKWSGRRSRCARWMITFMVLTIICERGLPLVYQSCFPAGKLFETATTAVLPLKTPDQSCQWIKTVHRMVPNFFFMWCVLFLLMALFAEVWVKVLKFSDLIEVGDKRGGGG